MSEVQLPMFPESVHVKECHKARLIHTIQDAMADSAMTIDIRMVNRSAESALWRESRVIFFHVKVEYEHSISISTLWRLRDS